MSAAGCRRVYGGGMEGALLIANEMGSDTFNYPLTIVSESNGEDHSMV